MKDPHLLEGKILNGQSEYHLSKKTSGPRPRSHDQDHTGHKSAMEKMKAETQPPMVTPLWILDQFGPSRKVMEANNSWTPSWRSVS
eukprot:scaffold656_cov66-Cylindrotheca_fusiformis.AAC.1